VSTLELLVFLPLLAALAVGLGAPARFTALGASVLVLLVAVYCAINFNSSQEGGMQFESTRTLLEMPGFPKLSLAFGLDGISLVLVLLSALVLVAAIFVAPQ